jgi:hypothetical protein
MSVIIATQEAEIRRTAVQSQFPGQVVCGKKKTKKSQIKGWQRG